MKKNQVTIETEENHKDRDDCSTGKWISSEHVGSSLHGHLAAETQKYWKNAGIQEGKAQVRGKAGKQAVIKASTLSNTREITPWTYFSPLGEDFQITPFQEQHPNSKGNKHQ